jgi:hypothetical protein
MSHVGQKMMLHAGCWSCSDDGLPNLTALSRMSGCCRARREQIWAAQKPPYARPRSSTCAEETAAHVKCACKFVSTSIGMTFSLPDMRCPACAIRCKSTPPCQAARWSCVKVGYIRRANRASRHVSMCEDDVRAEQSLCGSGQQRWQMISSLTSAVGSQRAWWSGAVSSDGSGPAAGLCSCSSRRS